MKIEVLSSFGKSVWKNNKPFFVFAFLLLTIYSLLKIIFYYYNHQFIFENTGEKISNSNIKNVIKWSLLYDILIIGIVNAPLVIFLQLVKWKLYKFLSYTILPFFILLNSIVIALNIIDIFYFRFHFQRADADLLYVLDYPLKKILSLNFFILIGIVILAFVTFFLATKLCLYLYRSFKLGNRCSATSIVFLAFFLVLPFFKNYFTRILVPNYPLINLSSKQLFLVQNSFQTFMYSLFRHSNDATIKNYMPIALSDKEFPLKKIVAINPKEGPQKNIVLFIMESVPFDFFDSTNKYKVSMPFLDSIIQKSTFFNNAFSYALESNKGITAVLAGTPTLTDIPLYHTAFVNLPITPVGEALTKNNYNSFFCIGDEYDNFGFAECANWLGIKRYYSRDDMGKFVTKSPHTMGLQDEDVLNFMVNKIGFTKQPFFAVNYNLSTHYPYDIPDAYSKHVDKKYTDAMKSMSYYDFSLHKFFNEAQHKPWFKNTVFIFCPDHWMFPNDNVTTFNAVNSHRIPIIVYEPPISEKKFNSLLVSQFDILGTLLALGRYKDTMISYGGNLLDSASLKQVAFSKINDGLYQIIDTAFVLGFNTNSNQVEYLYHYKTDKNLEINLFKTPTLSTTSFRLTNTLKAFLQNATRQYHGLIPN